MLNFSAESYTGTKIGTGYMHREGVQIVCTDKENGKRRAIFKTRVGRTPCYKMGEWASHYKTGMNKHDAAQYVETMKYAKKLAAKWNKAGDVDSHDL